MAHSTLLKLACVLLACMAAAARAAVTCGRVSSALAPCIPSTRSGTRPMPASCCNRIKSLNSVAQTTPDKGATKSAPYKISPGTNCDSVK